MPLPRDGGNALAVGVGVAAAVIAGTLAVILSSREIIDANSSSIGWAAIGALYTLFAFRCLATRGK
jgi:hypothetical protein